MLDHVFLLYIILWVSRNKWKAQVINTKGNPISGLYAAGEVTGGIHGTNRLWEWNALASADITVFW